MPSPKVPLPDKHRRENGARSGADDYRLLLTIIVGISLGVAATAMPALIAGPYASWTYAAMIVMWLTGVAAVIVEYLSVYYGSRMYFRRVDVVATSGLAFVFLAIAGMFAVISMDRELIGTRWFVMFTIFGVVAGLEAEHGRRVIVGYARRAYDPDAVDAFGVSLRQVTWLLFVAALGSLLFAVIWSDPPPVAVFVGACAALASMVAANIQQHRIRERLDEYGVLGPVDDHRPSENLGDLNEGGDPQ